MEAVADTAVPNVAAHADPHSAEQLGIDEKPRRQVAAVFAFEVRDDLLASLRRKLGSGLDGGGALLHFKAKQPLVRFQNMDVVARLLFDQRFDERRNPAAIELAVDHAGA